MQSLAIIKTEHRNLGVVLFTLEKLVEEIENGKEPDFRVFHGLLTYIDRFLDARHHPKEDEYLFPVLAERCPEVADALAERRREHDEGEKLLVQVLKALSAYEFAGKPELGEFANRLRQYVAFERRHATEEEKHILPAARRTLTAEDWQRIDAAFCDNRDPLFSESRNEEFERLYTAITTLVPAPYGVGSEWSSVAEPDRE